MAGANRVVTVNATATRLDTVTETDSRSGSSAAVYNSGSVTVYVGTAADVSTTTGFPVAASSYGPTFDLGPDDAVYGIVASGTGTMIVVETGV